ncbi:uncharacterized protein LOC125746323 [Brienomyrus brachyistius]|uniref:uncharacterized protein LOC125746323 n=1 Tax=Brienomyrus brachyistius TaxID=42636 RepID=UPI0020B3D310|nr:uncharacterized protein LOC125746323 [Brienomyrus brachyistius]
MQQKMHEPVRGTSLTIRIRIHCIYSILLAVLWTPWTTGSQTGRFPKPTMEVEPKIVSWTQLATVRCSAQKGYRCNFYTNESHVPFKTVQFKSLSGICQAQVMWNEVSMSSHNVVIVSCDVEVNVESGIPRSPRSDGQIFQVIDLTSELHVDSMRDARLGDVARLRCTAKQGTRCQFIAGVGEAVLDTVLFRHGVCQLSVPGRELLRHSQGGIGPVPVRCVVELELRDGALRTSKPSAAITIEVHDFEEYTTQFTASLKYDATEASTFSDTVSVTAPAITVDSPKGVHMLLWSVIGGLSALFLMGVLITLLTLKQNFSCCKRNPQQVPDAADASAADSHMTGSDLQNYRGSSPRLVQDLESDVCYASVLHPNSSHFPPSERVTMETQDVTTCLYATVNKPSRCTPVYSTVREQGGMKSTGMSGNLGSRGVV